VEEPGITVSVLNTEVWNHGTIFKEPVCKQLSQKKNENSGIQIGRSGASEMVLE
jgi:hypothetical protein